MTTDITTIDKLNNMFADEFNTTFAKHDRKAFLRFKKNVTAQNFNFSEEELEKLFCAASGGTAYWTARTHWSKKDIERFTILFNRFVANIDATPRAASELMGGQLEFVPYSTQYQNIRYHLDGVSNIDTEMSYVTFFRKFIKRLTKAGIIKETPVKVCGKVAIYLYSID